MLAAVRAARVQVEGEESVVQGDQVPPVSPQQAGGGPDHQEGLQRVGEGHGAALRGEGLRQGSH